MRRFSGRVTPCMRADDRRRPRPAQHVAQRQAGGQRVRVGLVVQQDQHAVGVGEVALVLLHARARQRSAELGRQRGRQQLRQVEVRDLRHDRAQLVLAAPVGHAVDVQDVEQAAAGVADGGDDPLQAALAVVFDDDAGVRREVGAEIGIHALGIGRPSPARRRRRDVEPAGGFRRGTRCRRHPRAPDAASG